MKLRYATSILCLLAAAAGADMVQQLSNPDSITVDASRADWSGVTAYQDDSSGESGIGPFDVDWTRVSIAHSIDGSQLYVRYQLSVGADFGSFPAFYNLFLDTDQNRSSGYIGGGSQLPVGAEYLLQGGALFAFTGANQTDFSWSPVGSATTDNSFANLDIEIGLSAALIGSPEQFDFILLGDNALNGNTQDYYPDAANGGATGDFFRYVVPEPSTAGALLIGGLAVIGLRRMRRLR